MTLALSLRRVLPASVGGVLFLVLAALWLTGAHQSYAAFSLLGVRSFRFPFPDTHTVSAAIECHRLGIDVYAINPCDVLGRLDEVLCLPAPSIFAMGRSIALQKLPTQ